jgi:hypothetical protein
MSSKSRDVIFSETTKTEGCPTTLDELWNSAFFSENLTFLDILDMHFANIVVLLSTVCIFYKIQVHEV